MKKCFLFTAFLMFSGISFCFAQGSVSQATSSKLEMKKAELSLKRIKYENPQVNTSNEYVITGTGGASFSVSNVSDGSPLSFVHTRHITLSLLTNKKDIVELVFYSDNEQVPVAVNQSGDKIIIYYPLSMYEGIRQKLEQNLAVKKKITLKVLIQTNGMREGELIF